MVSGNSNYKRRSTGDTSDASRLSFPPHHGSAFFLGYSSWQLGISCLFRTEATGTQHLNKRSVSCKANARGHNLELHTYRHHLCMELGPFKRTTTRPGMSALAEVEDNVLEYNCAGAHSCMGCQTVVRGTRGQGSLQSS